MLNQIATIARERLISIIGRRRRIKKSFAAALSIAFAFLLFVAATTATFAREGEDSASSPVAVEPLGTTNLERITKGERIIEKKRVAEGEGITKKDIITESGLVQEYPAGFSTIRLAEVMSLRFLHRLRDLYGGRQFNPLAIDYSLSEDASASPYNLSALVSAVVGVPGIEQKPAAAFKEVNGPHTHIMHEFMCATHRTMVPAASRGEVVRSAMAQFFEKPFISDVVERNRLAAPDVAAAHSASAPNNNATAVGNRNADAIFSTARPVQCLMESAHHPVLSLDRGALGPAVVNTSGALRDPALSKRFEKLFQFDNSHVYAKERGWRWKPFPKVDPVSATEEGGARPSWDSALFYEGPASDSFLPNHADKAVREQWARRKVPWVATRNPSEVDSYNYWADYDDEAEDGNLPCTQYVQHRIHAMMNPHSCDGRAAAEDDVKDPFDIQSEGHPNTRFFAAQVRDKTWFNFGFGAALDHASYDVLVAIVLRRVVLLQFPKHKSPKFFKKIHKWSYTPNLCVEAGRPMMDCFYQYPSHCQRTAPPEVFNATVLSTKNEALTVHNATRSLQKQIFDRTRGFARGNIPSDAEFFGNALVKAKSKCYQRYLDWTGRDQSHNYLPDTFPHSANPRLNYMTSQVIRYMLRYQQPWFYNMLSQGMGQVGMGRGVPEWGSENPSDVAAPPSLSSLAASPSSDNKPFAAIMLHTRAERLKYWEQFSGIGCHTVRTNMMVDLVRSYCGLGLPHTALDAKTVVKSRAVGTIVVSPETAMGIYQPPCHVFISGNTPLEEYRSMKAAIEAPPAINDNLPAVATPIITSTWSISGGGAEPLTPTAAEKKKSPAKAPTVTADPYGATSPAAGWVDLYASVSATHWNCVAQSNWCRLINSLRVTSGRAVCGGFVDLGIMMMSSMRLREAYCVINTTWKMDPFTCGKRVKPRPTARPPPNSRKYM